MKQFIEYILKNIVSKPESVIVEESEDQGQTLYSLTVAPEDMGIVIGKEGRNINAIRNMAKAKAIKENVRIRIFLNEEPHD